MKKLPKLLENIKLRMIKMTKRKHTISILVENKPGVLQRISGLFTRRNFNIDNITVGKTEEPTPTKRLTMPVIH